MIYTYIFKSVMNAQMQIGCEENCTSVINKKKRSHVLVFIS